MNERVCSEPNPAYAPVSETCVRYSFIHPLFRVPGPVLPHVAQ